jgi:hypothetical protein
MSDDRPSPLRDARKGLGLLFRAARTAVGRLPTTDLEEVVLTSAREVGRAIENVAVTIEREMLGKKKPRAEASHSATGGDEGKSKDAEPSGEQSKPGEPPHTK